MGSSIGITISIKIPLKTARELRFSTNTSIISSCVKYLKTFIANVQGESTGTIVVVIVLVRAIVMVIIILIKKKTLNESKLRKKVN